MACGVPVVATNVGDSSPIVGTSGYVVNPGDRSAMLACIDQLVALPASHRRSMGASGRARIESRFSIERSVALFDRLLLRGEMEDEGERPIFTASVRTDSRSLRPPDRGPGVTQKQTASARDASAPSRRNGR
jgi:hypothetical protein